MDDAERPEKETARSALIHLHLYVTRKILLWGFAGLIVCSAVYGIFSDTLTMTAYYPSPQGVYWKLWSTADTVLGRDQLVSPSAPSVVQIGGDSVKGRYNTASSILTVYGNTTLAKNISIPGTPTGNLTVAGSVTTGSGVVLPQMATAGQPCGGVANGTVALDASNNVDVCAAGTWTGVGGGLPAGTLITIMAATCPSGYKQIMGYYPSTTSCGTGSAWYSCPLGCTTTGTGWLTTTPTCSYTTNYYLIDCNGTLSCPGGYRHQCDTGMPSDHYGYCCAGPNATCTATATEVQCQKS